MHHELLRLSGLFLVTGAALSFVGCAGSDGPELGEVSGLVTLNGDPLPNATVHFTPDEGRPSRGETDEDGRYTLMYTNENEGAVPGQHTVRISTAVAALEGEGGEGREAQPERVPPRYNSATDLVREVKPGSNKIDFELESDGATYQTGEEGGGAEVPDA